MAIKFTDLPTPVRAGLIVLAGVDAGLRFWAIKDVRSREQSEINGSKKLWTLGLAFVNSAGALPIAYLVRGRRKPTDEV